MKKWIASIIAAVIGGVAIWALTEFLPKRLEEPPPPPPVDDTVNVTCTGNPPTVAPGGTSEITVRVTQGGKPVKGAEVKIADADWGTTLSDGTTRAAWKAPSPAAAGYVMTATAQLPERDGGGSGAGDCNILVSG